MAVDKRAAWIRKFKDLGMDGDPEALASALARDTTVDILTQDEQKFEVTFLQGVGPGHGAPQERAVLRCRVSGWPHYYPYCELHVNKLRRVAKEEHLRFDVRKLNIQ
jgi:hypothetical protein